ncbi:MAG: CPBP family glutamic-type intramembrane protease [Methanoregula sp.]|jgi:membrane protease YdiL (CAAX protease family)
MMSIQQTITGVQDSIRQGRYRDALVTLPLIALFLILMVLSLAIEDAGTLGEFLLAGGMVAPFVILALLAYLGEKNRFAKVAAVLWFLGILLCTALITFLFILGPAGAFSSDPDTVDAWVASLPLAKIGIAFLVPFCAGLVCLLGFSRRFRGLLSRVIPIDPDSFVHTIGLVTVMAFIIMPVLPLAVTGNAPFLDATLQDVLGIGTETPGSSVNTDTFTLIWTIIGSFFLVGLWVRQDLKGTLARLGLVRPTLRQVILAVAIGVALVGVFWVLDDLLTSIFSFAGITVTDETMVNNLFVASFAPLAAVIAAISAGLGEELAVRGVVQPRFGIILAALLFAALHAYQYAWDGVIGVLIAGLCFGVLRKYTNTSTSAICHGTYDLVLFAIILAGLTTI